jgi:hypothetical protein
MTRSERAFYWLQLQDGYFRHCWGVKWVFMVLFGFITEKITKK